MIQTFEAVVDEAGKITLLTEIHLTKNRRALVTILDEEPKISLDVSVKMPSNVEVSDEDILSVWAAHEESAQKIARDTRERNR
jgi:hypothetical protein